MSRPPAFDSPVMKVPTASTIPTARDQQSPNLPQTQNRNLEGVFSEESYSRFMFTDRDDRFHERANLRPTDYSRQRGFSGIHSSQLPQLDDSTEKLTPSKSRELAKGLQPLNVTDGGGGSYADRFICVVCRNAIVQETLYSKARHLSAADARYDGLTNGCIMRNGNFNDETTATSTAFGQTPDYIGYDHAMYPKVLTEDKADVDLDCISLAVADETCSRSAVGSGGASRHSLKTHIKETIWDAILKISELLITFVAVVCLWGTIDDVVEVIAKSDPKWGIAVYLCFFAGALMLQFVCNKLLSTSMSLARGIDLF